MRRESSLVDQRRDFRILPAYATYRASRQIIFLRNVADTPSFAQISDHLLLNDIGYIFPPLVDRKAECPSFAYDRGCAPTQDLGDLSAGKAIVMQQVILRVLVRSRVTDN